MSNAKDIANLAVDTLTMIGEATGNGKVVQTADVLKKITQAVSLFTAAREQQTSTFDARQKIEALFRDVADNDTEADRIVAERERQAAMKPPEE